MKKLLLSFIIVIFSNYPVHAIILSKNDSIEVITKGKIIASESESQNLTAWVLYEGDLHWCFAKTRWMYGEDYHKTEDSYIEIRCTKAI